jgi:hypothetical protein
MRDGSHADQQQQQAAKQQQQQCPCGKTIPEGEGYEVNTATGVVLACLDCAADIAESDAQAAIAEYETTTFAQADDSVLFGPYSTPYDS